jgi:2-polyprenyl-6-methoxyphenol hydroxylase-like FAD-dependent oxidoreductase
MGSRAIVIGGSIAGLTAARVLQPHFDQVVILDRDALSDTPFHRQGVPQGRHGHGLLAGGLRALSTLFPTLEADLRAAGAVPGDVVRDIRWHQHGYDKLQFRSGLDGLLFGRPLLEATLRAHVRRLPRITFADKVVVQRLLMGPDGRTVTGVRMHPIGCPEYSCHADLVVDASGRSSRAPQWLAEHGFERPRLEELSVNIGYMTRIYRRHPEDFGGNIGAIVAPRPPHQRRIGFMLALEGDRWIVGLGGWMGDHAPADREGYLAFAKSLARPYIHDVIARAEPLTDPVAYAFPSNRRRRYERVKHLPDRFVVMGDALCSFNPIYGQGMSVAALEGVALGEAIRAPEGLNSLGARFFSKAAAIVDGPWAVAAGGDLAFAGVAGHRPLGTALVNWYLSQVHRAAAVDPDVCLAFFQTANLLAPPSSLFRPKVMARVVASRWRHPASSGPSARHSETPGLDARHAVQTR